MSWLHRVVLACLLTGCSGNPAGACPVCSTETGKHVRGEIFDRDFGRNFATLLLPFPIFLGIAAAIHYGLALGEPARETAAARDVNDT